MERAAPIERARTWARPTLGASGLQGRWLLLRCSRARSFLFLLLLSESQLSFITCSEVLALGGGMAQCCGPFKVTLESCAARSLTVVLNPARPHFPLSLNEHNNTLHYYSIRRLERVCEGLQPLTVGNLLVTFFLGGILLAMEQLVGCRIGFFVSHLSVLTL